MRNRLLAPAAAAALALSVHFGAPAPAAGVDAAPAAGPGGVLVAIEELFAALDRGDRDAIQALIVPSPHDYSVAYGKDGKPMHDAKDEGEGRVDVPMVADPLLAQLTQGAQASAPAKPGIRHRIRAVRANCPAEDCSYGVVQFDRIRTDGDDEQVTPMRATVLTRYDRKTQRMRIFLWQVAPAS